MVPEGQRVHAGKQMRVAPGDVLEQRRLEWERRFPAGPADFDREAALAAAAAFRDGALLRTAHRLAAFIAADAELDPGPMIALARARGRAVYLPTLRPPPHRTLAFVRAEAGAELRPNRYGIPEPSGGPEVDPRFLDLVLVPVVGFDGAGNRLGMGAGYYDRTFAFRGARREWRGPRLIGVAYDCQEVDAIDARDWDVPLDGIVTESGVRIFERRK